MPLQATSCSRTRDTADVLSEGVPLAEVTGPGEAERTAHGAPHAVGRDYVTRLDRGAVVELDDRPVSGAGETGEASACPQRHTRLRHQVDERGVELATRSDRGVRAISRERELDLASARCAQQCFVHDRPTRDGARIESQRCKLA